MDIQKVGVGSPAGGYQPPQVGGAAGAAEAGASKEAEETSGVQGAAEAQKGGQCDCYQQCPGSIREAQESNAHNNVDKVAQFKQAMG